MFDKKRIEKATVRLKKLGGQGVLVNNHFIITAAHCVEFNCEGIMALGEYFIEELETYQGTLKVAPLAVEPVSDVAVLGDLDSQEFGDEVDKFGKFCDETKPVPLCGRDFELFKPFPVYIYTHKKTWVTGKAQQCSEDTQRIWIDYDEYIEGGTSGGPIVDEFGKLIGVISVASENKSEGENRGHTSRLDLALPVWAYKKIKAGRK